MNPEDKSRYVDNYHWFNGFFGDIRQLFLSIHAMLKSELSYRIGGRGWYYEKSNHVPKIPPYWVTGISESGFALQTFAILNPSLLEAHPKFTDDLSLVLVKHNHSSKQLYINEYGLKVIKNSQIIYRDDHERFFSGEIHGSKDPILFHAFQVPLSAFTTGVDVQQVILDDVVSVLRETPDWE